MSSGPIGFLDSGVGGIPYLAGTAAAAPGDSFAYYADNRFFPYGDRSVASIRDLVSRAAESLLRLAEPRAIVVACNTASVVALETLRERFDVPFVGVVPAIKPAAELVGTGRIGVLATARTVEDEYVTRLIRRFAPENEVVLVAAGGLVELIERRLGEFAPEELRAALTEPIEKLQAARVDAVVLGCTHFIHVRPEIERLLAPGTTVVDSVEGVVRQTLRIAGAPARVDAPVRTPPTVYLTRFDDANTSYHYLARVHGLDLSDAHARHRAYR